MMTNETFRNHWCNKNFIQMSVSKIIDKPDDVPEGYQYVTDWSDVPPLRYAGEFYSFFKDDDYFDRIKKELEKTEHDYEKNSFGQIMLDLEGEEGIHKLYANLINMVYGSSYFERHCEEELPGNIVGAL